jgi:hypothetical protein
MILSEINSSSNLTLKICIKARFYVVIVCNVAFEIYDKIQNKLFFINRKTIAFMDDLPEIPINILCTLFRLK